jgi:hypothetical protein
MKRLRELFESIVFAGMKPGARPGPTQSTKWLRPLRGPVERLLSGSAPSDPLYLTNRSLGQRIKSWSLVTVLCLFIMGLVALTLNRDFFAPAALLKAVRQKEPSAGEMARKTQPNIDRNIKIDTNKDVEVVQVHLDRSAMKVTGTVRNNTTHDIAVTDVVFNLTDKSGSQLGAVSGHIQNLPPKTTKDFEFPIKQADATFVLVRELSTSR